MGGMPLGNESKVQNQGQVTKPEWAPSPHSQWGTTSALFLALGCGSRPSRVGCFGGSRMLSLRAPGQRTPQPLLMEGGLPTLRSHFRKGAVCGRLCSEEASTKACMLGVCAWEESSRGRKNQCLNILSPVFTQGSSTKDSWDETISLCVALTLAI